MLQNKRKKKNIPHQEQVSKYTILVHVLLNKSHYDGDDDEDNDDDDF